MPEVELHHVIATLGDGSELATPWWRVRSGEDGPDLLVLAAQHGNEVQGAEVIRRFACECGEALLRGTAWLVPFANLPAIRHRRNSILLGPEEKGTERHRAHNMNGQWPGDQAGNDIQRLGHALHEEIVRYASHVIDLHCWNKFWATATLATDDGGESRRMGEVAGTRFTWWREAAPVELPAQIRGAVVARGGAGMAMELSGQYVMVEREVQTGVRTVTNVAKVLGMLAGEPDLPPDTGIDVTDDTTAVVEAPCSGLFVQAPELQLEDRVEAGQSLGHIIRDDDLSVEEIAAPVGGWLWRFGSHRPDPDVSLADQHPYSQHGDPLASIVTG